MVSIKLAINKPTYNSMTIFLCFWEYHLKYQETGMPGDAGKYDLEEGKTLASCCEFSFSCVFE